MWYGFVAHLFVGFQAVSHAYATYPIPLDLAFKCYVSGLVMSLLIGAILISTAVAILFRSRRGKTA